MLVPLTTVVIVAVGVLGAQALLYLLLDRLVDDAMLLVTAIVEIALVVLAVVTAVVQGQVSGTGQGATMLAYALTLPGQDARPLARELNAAFDGRGGGKPELCQGSLAAPIDKDAAAAFFRRWAADHAEPTS